MKKKIYSTILLTICFFTESIQAQNITKFRFAQLTDTHLSVTNPARTEHLLRTIAHINATDSIDFVLASGDLTNEGDKTSLELVKSCLDLLKVPYYVIPGNHETKWSSSACTAFTEVFGYERFSFDHKGIFFIGFNSGFPMRMADGHIALRDIRWITAELKEKGTEQPIIAITHYPIQENDVDNWQQILQTIYPYNICLFIGGHYHRIRQFDSAGIPGILMRTSQSSSKTLPSYGIYEVTSDSIIAYVQNTGKNRQKISSYPLHSRLNHLVYNDKVTVDSLKMIYPNVKNLWCVSTDTEIYASPIMKDGKIYVGDESGIMTAYSLKNGKKQWQFTSGGRIIGTADTAEGILVFGSADHSIYGLDAQNGRLLWKVKTQAPVVGAVTIDHGIAYIGGSDHTFRAIDIHNGMTLWAYPSVKGYIETKPLITGNKVIFGAWDNTIYALDKTSGQELWKWETGQKHMFYSPAATWPVAAHGKVFIADPKRALTAIDEQTGQTVWRTYQSQVRESIGISTDTDRIYAKTMNDSVVCYTAIGSSPEQLWASNVGFGREFAPSMLVEKEKILFGSTKRGVIFGLDAQTGRVLWKYKVGTGVVNTVLPLDKHRVLYTIADGKIGLLTIKE